MVLAEQCTLQHITDDLFVHIMSFVDPFFEIDLELSRQKEIVILFSIRRKFEMNRRLLKCVELWWRKTKFQMLIREFGSLFYPEIGRGMANNIINVVISHMWEDRCWKINEKQIHCIYEGKKWYNCEQCHFFPHSISDDGSRFEYGMTPWG